MARFEFPLQRVLHYKEQRERLAEMAQHRAIAVCRACEAEAAALRRRIDEMAATLNERLGGNLDLAAWLANYRVSERLGRELGVAEARAREAAVRLSEATAQRRRQALEAEALRQLKSRQKKQYLEELAREEQKLLDEQGLRSWHSPERGGAGPEDRTP